MKNIFHLITSSNCWKDFEQALALLEKTEKGRAFEELTRLHLLTDPIFSSKIKQIWHHKDVPQKIVDELGLQRPEIGMFHNKPVETPRSKHADMSDEELQKYIYKKLYKLGFLPLNNEIKIVD